MVFPKHIVLQGFADAYLLNSFIRRQDYRTFRDFLAQTFGVNLDLIDQIQLLILKMEKTGEIMTLQIRGMYDIELIPADRPTVGFN